MESNQIFSFDKANGYIFVVDLYLLEILVFKHNFICYLKKKTICITGSSLLCSSQLLRKSS